MSSTQTMNGKSYEYMVADHISKIANIPLIQDAMFFSNKANYEMLSLDNPVLFSDNDNKAKLQAIQFLELQTTKKPEFLYFNIDNAGSEGDVRDIVFEKNMWTGISCKNNNTEIKSFRISETSDDLKIIGHQTDKSLLFKDFSKQTEIVDGKEVGIKYSAWSGKSASVNKMVDHFVEHVELADPNIFGKFIFGSDPYYKFVSYKKKDKFDIIDYSYLNRVTYTKISNVQKIKNKSGKSTTLRLDLDSNIGTQTLQIRFKNGETRIKTPQWKASVTLSSQVHTSKNSN